MNIHDTLLDMTCGIPEDILRRKYHGDFSGALRLIDLRLRDASLSQSQRNALLIQKRICQHLPEEFPYSREEALALVRRDIPDFTEEEFDALTDSRDIRWIYVEGQMRYFNRFDSSLFTAVPGFAQRASRQSDAAESAAEEKANFRDVTIAKMKASGSLTTHIRVRATVKLPDASFTPGMFLRAHLPIPAACQQQEDIRIEKLWPENAAIAPADAPQRTVCWELTPSENTEFGVEYSYLHTARYHDAYHGTGLPGRYDHDLQQQPPHLVFTPCLQNLCRELTQGLTDPLARARAIYDHITLHMHYTYMPSYYLLENIAENCALSRTGDCGVFALLFITLCRCAGIPAQWQSGLTVEPNFIGAHDWARFYVEPYGWLFTDPSYGVSAARAGAEERRQFYFGNLDPYRMVANSAFQTGFTVPKAHWRADPYDNQLGELESADCGYLLDEYQRSKVTLLCEEVPTP